MMFSAKQAPFTVTASLLMALQPLLLTLSKGNDGYFAYSVPSATMLCEFFKLIFSGASLTVLLIRQPELRSKTIGERPAMEFLQFLVPSLIYFANNNLAFVILQVAAPCPLHCAHASRTPPDMRLPYLKSRVGARFGASARALNMYQPPLLRSRSIRPRTSSYRKQKRYSPACCSVGC